MLSTRGSSSRETFNPGSCLAEKTLLTPNFYRCSHHPRGAERGMGRAGRQGRWGRRLPTPKPREKTTKKKTLHHCRRQTPPPHKSSAKTRHSGKVLVVVPPPARQRRRRRSDPGPLLPTTNATRKAITGSKDLKKTQHNMMAK